MMLWIAVLQNVGLRIEESSGQVADSFAFGGLLQLRRVAVDLDQFQFSYLAEARQLVAAVVAAAVVAGAFAYAAAVAPVDSADG